MIEADTKNIKRLERDLKAFAHRSVPFANREALNSAAFAARQIAQRRIGEQFTMRAQNDFVRKSVRVQKATGLNIRAQHSIVGSTFDGMAGQEFGEVKRKQGKEGVRIATSFAAGEGEQAKPRTKLPRKMNRIENIKLQKMRGRKPKTRKQRTVFAVQQAVLTGKRQVYLELGSRPTKGIFRVKGGSRRGIKRGWPRGTSLKMLHDLTRPAVTIPPSPWLAPSVKEVEPQLPGLYARALEFQAKRHGLFKSR